MNRLLAREDHDCGILTLFAFTGNHKFPGRHERDSFRLDDLILIQFQGFFEMDVQSIAHNHFFSFGTNDVEQLGLRVDSKTGRVEGVFSSVKKISAIDCKQWQRIHLHRLKVKGIDAPRSVFFSGRPFAGDQQAIAWNIVA